MRSLPSLSLLALATLVTIAWGAAACLDAPVKNEVPPAGVLRGSFLYTGPPPCTEGGHVVGQAVLLVFDERLLPPPEGLATRSARIKVIPGQELFAEVAKHLPYAPDGARVCPATGTGTPSPVVASAPWDLSPLEGGAYQIRAFYDYDGDFHPAFRFANLPTLGDVTGGAFADVASAFRGQPSFARIEVGSRDAAGAYVVPPTGVLVDNVTVAVALPQSVQRPYFYVDEVQPPKASLDDAKPAAMPRPVGFQLPADVHIGNANPLDATRPTQDYLTVFRLQAGVYPEERPAAVAPPFLLKLDIPAQDPIPTYWYDANRDGKVDDGDHVTGSSTNAPAFSPIVSFTKLDAADPIQRNTQVAPRVLTSAISLPTASLLELLGQRHTEPRFQSTVWAALRPSVICIPDAADAGGPTLVVTPFEQDLLGNPVIADPGLFARDVGALLKRDPARVEIAYGCLPPGAYALNVVNATGQAWTVPNEMGLCLPGERDTGDRGRCEGSTPEESRARLTSQSFLFRVGPASDGARCASVRDTDAGRKIRALCLTEGEQRRFDEGTLWSP